MTRLTAVMMLAAGTAAMLPAGCVRCPDTHLTREQLVASCNANAEKVPRLWARAKIRVAFVDPDGRHIAWGSTSPVAATNGLLMLSKTLGPGKPADFVLIGKETLGVDLFHVGNSAEEGKYYLWFKYGSHGTAWWGWDKYAGAPGVEQIPLDPNQLLSVLTIRELPSDLATLPTVLLRMSRDPCAYVLTYVDHQPVTGKIVATRDVYYRWSLDQPARPFMVRLFSPDGDEVMTAKLARYAPIGGTGGETAPVMPTDISISWPGRQSSVHVVLSEMTAADKWDVEVCRFQEELPPGFGPDNIVQIDRRIEEERPRQ
jgi:hypothetical protein